MLIKTVCTSINSRNSTPTHQTQQITESPTDWKLRHRRTKRNLPSMQRCVSLLIAFIMLLQAEMHTCHPLTPVKSNRFNTGNGIASSSIDFEPQNFDSTMSKRSELTNDAAVGQPEEIFTINDKMESNYDEYPMIVPKRAALLLDRLMVALHRALENERNGQRRIGELIETSRNDGEEVELKQQGATQIDSMYGDDPNALMDYDFKDMNSINRATGETLIGKSFQRRANIASNDGGLALAAKTGTKTKAGNVGGGRINTGYTYWRCYFNAISCF